MPKGGAKHRQRPNQAPRHPNLWKLAARDEDIDDRANRRYSRGCSMLPGQKSDCMNATAKSERARGLHYRSFVMLQLPGVTR